MKKSASHYTGGPLHGRLTRRAAHYTTTPKKGGGSLHGRRGMFTSPPATGAPRSPRTQVPPATGAPRSTLTYHPPGNYLGASGPRCNGHAGRANPASRWPHRASRSSIRMTTQGEQIQHPSGHAERADPASRWAQGPCVAMYLCSAAEFANKEPNGILGLFCWPPILIAVFNTPKIIRHRSCSGWRGPGLFFFLSLLPFFQYIEFGEFRWAIP